MPPTASPSWRDLLPEAKAIHWDAPVFLGYVNFDDSPFLPRGGRQADLEKLEAAGVRTWVASIGFGCYFQTGPEDFVLAGSNEWLREQQFWRVEYVSDKIRACPQTRLVASRADLADADDGTIGVIIHLTGNNHTTDVETVDEFFRRGVRASHPAMDYHNLWCRGAREVRVNGRLAPILSGFGREVIARMNELGIVLDTAHMCDPSACELIRASRRPVIDSHTGSRTLAPSSRGLSDETFRLLADKGGVIGIHLADHMLTDQAQRRKYAAVDGPSPGWFAYNRHVVESTDDPAERLRLRRNQDAKRTFYQQHGFAPEPTSPSIRGATLGDMADAIDHLVDVAGIEHVAIGGDVNGIEAHQWPKGMDHIGELPHLTAMLLARKYSHEALHKLLAGNWRRVYTECLPA